MRRIDRGARTPPHHQIADYLRAEIAAGKYSPQGPALPSVNRLAQEWDVARGTALKALQVLREEGLIEVEDGMGYYVRRELQVCHITHVVGTTCVIWHT